MRKIIVSDTTAITHLAKINLLGMLHALYEEILIPEAVHYELSQVNPAQVGALQVLNSPWIKVVAVKNRIVVTKLQSTLDLGESEAIALAIERKADVLIIDEVKGRAVAKQLVTKIIGMAGVLIEAKKLGVIQSIKPHLLALKSTGFKIGDDVIEYALQVAGESTNDAAKKTTPR
jgi:predicted nucleic acid-binding protein